ncbi:transposase [Myxococcota bacterium]|nr:transposase [Myxococcota bacterium]
MLYGTVQAELETFLAQALARERPVPRFVEREFRGFLRCGILAHGFVRVHCDGCGLDRVVAFSCKGRGFCPSCGGRRMADTAAHLVDRVVPEVPVRQWVLSLPFALRYRLAYDAPLTSAVLGVFVRTVIASLRRRAREQWGVTRGQCGAVTVVQRFGDALNLNVHFHSLLLDGVYAPGPDGALRFHPLPPPEDPEVERVVGQVARRIVRLLVHRGLGPESDLTEADPLAEDQPLLAQLYGASVAGRIATGRRAGQRVVRVGDCIDPEDLPALEGERCASVSGVSLHANVAVPACDRRRLERLCRYVARSPVATERLSRLEDGRLLYRLKHRWRDGTTHVVFEPQELVEKLAALVPPPRFHLVRYHGILGPCAGERDRVVPGSAKVEKRVRPPPPNPSVDLPAEPPSTTAGHGHERVPIHDPCNPPSQYGVRATPVPAGSQAPPPGTDEPALRPRRLAWAELLRRVFAVDVLECPRCGGRMRLLAAIQPPDVTKAILDCLELSSRAPPTAAALPDPDDAEEWPGDFEATL